MVPGKDPGRDQRRSGHQMTRPISSSSPDPVQQSRQMVRQPNRNCWNKIKIVKNQQPQIKQKHKSTTRIINSKYPQLEFLPVQWNKLPYNMPDWNETPADKKECRQNLNIQQGGQIVPRKYLTRCLYSSNNINKQVRLEKRVTINCNEIAPSYTQQEQHRNRFKTGFMTDINIFLNSS